MEKIKFGGALWIKSVFYSVSVKYWYLIKNSENVWNLMECVLVKGMS